MSEAARQTGEQLPNFGHMTEARRCKELVTPHSRDTVRLWWQRLVLGPAEAQQRQLPPPWPRGVRANLRRCETADAAVLTEGFRHLWQMSSHPEDDRKRSQRRRDIHAWACAALVAAELRDETTGITPAWAFGSQRKETEKPWVSELRFQQLQQSQSADELVRRMRRAIALVGHDNISVVNLVDDVLLWCRQHAAENAAVQRRPEDRIAFRWANDYYTALARYQHE